jgi:hypothetical protein
MHRITLRLSSEKRLLQSLQGLSAILGPLLCNIDWLMKSRLHSARDAHMIHRSVHAEKRQCPDAPDMKADIVPFGFVT